ncbi:unnamed protein product [Bursaphelenchus xylophilus]|uniref:(pine wood nematode) hypothetical protein n=1 Tax=Bursaphelenchus xylophilus TaxID=6326 RepID=A0A1I7SC07_BURXY|nr:unnamed protein product [Bursaphelenchus xylophilus]CAG9086363.1 unnamed protein product [Bursaphelenchus xylophilus]
MLYFFGFLLLLRDVGSFRFFNLDQSAPLNVDLYEPKETHVKLDHSDYTNTDTFKLKYLINGTHFKPGGPLFFYAGNEGTIEGFARNTGIMYSMAPAFDALIVFGEHRYYGNESSMPFGNESYTSVKRARYLTTEQTLGDFAQLINQLRVDYNFSKVIAFGGSYGGMLAVWMRQKYPHIIHGAWASSAPIAYFRNANVEPEAFSRVVSETLEKFGCDRNTVSAAFKALDNLDYKDLNQIFEIKRESELKENKDVHLVKTYVREALEYGAMTVYPYPAEFLVQLPAWHLVPTCAPLSQKNVTDNTQLAKALHQAASVYYNTTESCVNPDFCGNQATKNLGWLPGWFWQTCTEIGMAMGSRGSPNDVFWDEIGNKTKEEMMIESCKGLKEYIDDYDVSMLDIDAIEMLYGFNAGESTNLILTQGDLDPWKSGRPTLPKTAISQQLFDFTIDASAHHLDLRWPNSCDPESVVEARKQIYKILKCWTNQDEVTWSCDGNDLIKPLPRVSTLFSMPIFFRFIILVLHLSLLVQNSDASFLDWAKNAAKANGISVDNNSYSYTEQTEFVYFTERISFTEGAQLYSTAPSMTTTSPYNSTKCANDRAWDCYPKRAQCHVPVYFNLMKKLCATTCQSCICMDRDLRCKDFVENGFCRVRFYSREVKLLFCGKSCGLCD